MSQEDIKLITFDIYQDIKNINSDSIGESEKVDLLELVKKLYVSLCDNVEVSSSHIETVIRKLVTLSQINVNYKNIYPFTLNKRLMFYIKALCGYYYPKAA